MKDIKLINLPLNIECTNFNDMSQNLCNFLEKGWKLENATSSGRGVVYILSKERKG